MSKAKVDANGVHNGKCKILVQHLLVFTYEIFLTSDATSNECFAGNGQIPERSDTGEYMKVWCKCSIFLWYNEILLAPREWDLLGQIGGDYHLIMVTISNKRRNNECVFLSPFSNGYSAYSVNGG